MAEPIPPSEYLAWASVLGIEVRPAEYAILHAMDMAFCEATNSEISDWRIREKERAAFERQMNSSRRKR